MDSSSSSRGRAYDVFISFRGGDIRKTFLSHFMSKLDHKLITAFKDYEIESGRSLDPELKQAIRSSRIAVVIFSENYGSSSWCLDDLLEIVQCMKEHGQMVIPVFYDLDPTHVRKQSGKFGEVFKDTCETKKEKEIQLWRRALTGVANLLGYHSAQWRNEAEMIEKIADDVLEKLLATTSSHDTHYFVGIEDHIAKMGKLLELESEKVIMVGIWGSSGMGKTTIARTLFNQLSRHFQGSIFIDRGFVAKSMQKYCGANPDDYNMKLDLQRNFLSEILRKKDIHIDHLGALGEKLQYQKVLIFIDDLYNEVVLEALAGQTLCFGSGSRIVLVTNDKDLLTAHGIDRIYEVGLPSTECSLKIFSRYAFTQEYPPEGLISFAYEVLNLAGRLPLGLKIMGSSLRGKNKEDCLNLLPRLRECLNGKIEKTLMFSYEGLDSQDRKIFRHIACSFNHMEAEHIKLLLADSVLGVDVGLNNLVNKSLIYVREGRVEMQRLLEELGRNIVLNESEPGKREFLWHPEDIREVLEENTGTKKVVGISLDTGMIDDTLHVNKSAFKMMPGLRFLEVYSYCKQEEVKLHIPESFDHLPRKLKLLSWSRFPLKCLPSTFCPKYLVKLIMPDSKLEKLWDGVLPLTCLVEMNLSRSRNLTEIPDLSTATNLEKLDLGGCESLVELPSSIKNLNKLTILNANRCFKLETLPNGINLKSLDFLDLSYCIKLRVFPEISTNISRLFLTNTIIEEYPSSLCLVNLEILKMDDINCKQVREGMQPQLTPFRTMLTASSLRTLTIKNMSHLLEIPSSSIQHLNNLKELVVKECRNLAILPTGINLKSLDFLDLGECSRLTTFPDISTNISRLNLSATAVREVPWWIEKFSMLHELDMKNCSKLEYIHLNVSKLKNLEKGKFQYCWALTGADLRGYTSEAIKEAANVDEADVEDVKAILDFSSCFSLHRVLLPVRGSCFFCPMILPAEILLGKTGQGEDGGGNDDIGREDFSHEDNMVIRCHEIEQGEDSDDGSHTQSNESESSYGDSDSDTKRIYKPRRLI